jgi:hypothetical protein
LGIVVRTSGRRRFPRRPYLGNMVTSLQVSKCVEQLVLLSWGVAGWEFWLLEKEEEVLCFPLRRNGLPKGLTKTCSSHVYPDDTRKTNSKGHVGDSCQRKVCCLFPGRVRHLQ